MNRIISPAILLLWLSAGAALAADTVPDGFTFAAGGRHDRALSCDAQSPMRISPR